jgi:DNA-binding CsgD family transcriptional regulator
MALTTAARVGAARPAGAVLEQAVALLDHTGAQLEGARARAELGSLLRRQGRARAGRTPLLEAETVAHDVGAAPLLAFVRQELALTGTRRPVRTERDDLTPAERRTARLAADGLKNREIAAALQLAEKTVELQLSQVYRKLGIRSRRQLPEALG